MHALIQDIEAVPALTRFGRVARIEGLAVEVTGAQGAVSLGGQCSITIGKDKKIPCEVVGFRDGRDQKVWFEQMLLKPNMVLSGYEAPNRAGIQEVAETTVRCFRRHVPAAVPGIVFLSGGQTDEDATAHLNAMNAMGPHPWELSFSYGRALQAPALKAWAGEAANVPAGRAAYLHRAKMNGLARSGSYSPDMETKVAA